MRATTLKLLGLAALLGAAGGWLVAVTANAFDLVPPPVPWTAPVAVFGVAALVGALARSTSRQIQVRRERIDPSRAVARLVLGKASALGGAVIAGGYAGYAGMFLSRLEAAGPRERVVAAAAGVVAGGGLAVAGWLLERACRVPPGNEQHDEQGGQSDTASGA